MVEKKNLRIVYMGTPDFAVEALRCLVEGGYNVVGVITMPDKPAGRGHKLQFSPVKQYALEHAHKSSSRSIISLSCISGNFPSCATETCAMAIL